MSHEKDSKYLSLTYLKAEPRSLVRDTIVDAFHAVAEHTEKLEKRIAELEQSRNLGGGRGR